MSIGNLCSTGKKENGGGGSSSNLYLTKIIGSFGMFNPGSVSAGTYEGVGYVCFYTTKELNTIQDFFNEYKGKSLPCFGRFNLDGYAKGFGLVQNITIQSGNYSLNSAMTTIAVTGGLNAYPLVKSGTTLLSNMTITQELI